MLIIDFSMLNLYKSAMDEIYSNNQKCVIIGDKQIIEYVKCDYPNAKFSELEERHLYYHEMILEKYGDHPAHQSFKVEHNIRSFSNLVKLLWIKPIMHENHFRTKNHMFISFESTNTGFNNLASEVNMLTRIACDDDMLLVKTIDFKGSFFTDEQKIKIFGDSEPKSTISTGVIWGSIENIEWLSVTYEGIFLQYLRNGYVGKELDYLMIVFDKYKDRFKVYKNNA